MPERSSTLSRHNCPCCGYPTLTERAAYEICELCNWEDDGQDDDSADEVWDGPNSDYSLTEARENFKQYRVMYSPDRNQRLTGGDSPHKIKTKGELMASLEQLARSRSEQVPQVLSEVARLEAALQAETERQVAAYEAAQRGDAQPLAQAERQRQATRPGLAVRGTFSPARAWWPAVVVRLARTLGSTNPRVSVLQ